jgi:hypothetical protein
MAMTVGGVTTGKRQPPFVDAPRRVTRWGISSAGVAVKYDSAMNVQDVLLVWLRMVTATKDSLKTALEVTAKPGGTVAVVPDSGDDLGVGATGSTNFIYPGGFRAEYNAHAPGTWRVEVPLKYIAVGV